MRSEGDTQWSFRKWHAQAQWLDRREGRRPTMFTQAALPDLRPTSSGLQVETPSPRRDSKVSFTGPSDRLHKYLKEQNQARKWGS